MHRYKLIIFDCDGVLIDSEIISANMLIEELRPYGVEIDRGFVMRHFLGRSYPTVLAEVRKTFGIALPDRFELDYRARLLKAFDAGLRVMPGAAETLADLTGRYCVATSSSAERARHSLQITGLSGLTEGRLFTASMVSAGKPAPDLFLRAAADMGADPSDCLVIEDSLNGIRAAHAAGMDVWRFVGGSHFTGLDLTEPADARPERRVASFAGLRAELGLPGQTETA